MSVLYALSNLVNGKPPSVRMVAGRSEALAGEVIVEEHPREMVWDAASQTLRERTTTERLAEARQEKGKEMEEAALAEIAGYFVTSQPDREMLGVLSVAATDPALLSDGQRALLDAVNATNAKLVRKLQEVAAATDPGVVTWA